MDMKKSFVISRTDHTVLKQTASRADVEQATLIAARFKAASVCVPPCYVEDAVRAADGQIRVCGVAGFPNGYVSTDAKIFEIAGMLEDGAEEIDVVLNIGALKAGETEYVKTELEALRALTEIYTESDCRNLFSDARRKASCLEADRGLRSGFHQDLDGLRRRRGDGGGRKSF